MGAVHVTTYNGSTFVRSLEDCWVASLVGTPWPTFRAHHEGAAADGVPIAVFHEARRGMVGGVDVADVADTWLTPLHRWKTPLMPVMAITRPQMAWWVYPAGLGVLHRSVTISVRIRLHGFRSV